MTNNIQDTFSVLEKIQADLKLLASYRKSGSRDLLTVNELQEIEVNNICHMRRTLGTDQEANQLFENAERETEIVLSAQEINGCDKLKALAKVELRIYRCFQVWQLSIIASDTFKEPERLLAVTLPITLDSITTENYWESQMPEHV